MTLDEARRNLERWVLIAPEALPTFTQTMKTILDPVPKTIRVLRNYPFDHVDSVRRPVVIRETDVGWDEAYKRWMSNQVPTSEVDDIEPRTSVWKARTGEGTCEGVFLGLVPL